MNLKLFGLLKKKVLWGFVEINAQKQTKAVRFARRNRNLDSLWFFWDFVETNTQKQKKAARFARRNLGFPKDSLGSCGNHYPQLKKASRFARCNLQFPKGSLGFVGISTLYPQTTFLSFQ